MLKRIRRVLLNSYVDARHGPLHHLQVSRRCVFVAVLVLSILAVLYVFVLSSKPDISVPASPNTIPFQTLTNVPRPTALIFSATPFNDASGSQRTSSLARALLGRLFDVRLLYLLETEQHAPGATSVNSSETHLTQTSIVHSSPAQFTAGLPTASMLPLLCLFELPHPDFLPYLEFVRRHFAHHVIVDWQQDWQDASGTGFNRISEDTIKQFVSAAHMLLAPTRSLLQDLSTMTRSQTPSDAVVLYLPNAGDDRLLSGDDQHAWSIPPDWPSRQSLSLLYQGPLDPQHLLSEWIGTAARALPHTAFILIGQQSSTDEQQPQPRNVYVLPPKPSAAMAQCIHQARACLLPVSPNQRADIAAPGVLYDCVFMRKPVFASPMPELSALAVKGVRIAGSAEEFAELCGTVRNTLGLSRGPGTLSSADDELREFASVNNWQHRIDTVLPATLRPRHSWTVIFLFMNNEDVMRRALRTLAAHSQGLDVEVIAVDNGATDNTASMIRSEFPHVHLLSNAVGGCSRGRNLAFNHSHGDYIAYFDSDMWFSSHAWMSDAEQILGNHPHIGALGWAGGWIVHPSKLTGPIMDSLLHGGWNAVARTQGYRLDVPYLGSGGMVLPRSVHERVRFDERYDPTSFEDTDLSFQVRALGYQLAWRGVSSIHHDAHGTTSQINSAALKELYARNVDIFWRKWSRSLLPLFLGVLPPLDEITDTYWLRFAKS